MFYLGVRYLLAAILLLPVARHLRHAPRETVRVGVLAGALQVVAIVTQTWGLQSTTASKAGFLTGLSVVLVPVFLRLFWKHPVSRRVWASVGLATTGIYVLSFAGFEPATGGDVLVLACAISYAFYIIYLDFKLDRVHVAAFAVVQCCTIAGISFALSAVFEADQLTGAAVAGWATQPALVGALVYMGVVGTGVVFLTQCHGQRRVPATRAALIFTLEPVFATAFGIALGGETLGWHTVVGAGLIFGAIVLASLANASRVLEVATPREERDGEHRERDEQEERGEQDEKTEKGPREEEETSPTKEGTAGEEVKIARVTSP